MGAPFLFMGNYTHLLRPNDELLSFFGIRECTQRFNSVINIEQKHLKVPEKNNYKKRVRSEFRWAGDKKSGAMGHTSGNFSFRRIHRRINDEFGARISAMRNRDLYKTKITCKEQTSNTAWD